MFSVASQYSCQSTFSSSWRTAFCLKILSSCIFEQLPYWTCTFSFRLPARPFNREAEPRAPEWRWLRTFNTLSLSVPTPSYSVQHYNSRLYYGFWCWTKPSTAGSLRSSLLRKEPAEEHGTAPGPDVGLLATAYEEFRYLFAPKHTPADLMWSQRYRGSEEETGCVATSLSTFSRSDTLVTSHEKTKEGSVRLM